MAAKGVFDKVLNFMGFEEDVMEDEEEKREEPDSQRQKKKEKGTLVGLPAQRQVRVVVTEPRSFDEAPGIADNLKSRRPVIVNLEQADAELAKRVLDFMTGAVYALNGAMQKVGSGIFLCVPNNIDITSELKDQGRDKGIFSWPRS
jgi:cell division inhibitor SepF